VPGRHAFSTNGLLIGKQRTLESALWAAIVALEERRDLYRRVRDRVGGRSSRRGQYYERYIAESERRAGVLRALFDELVAANEEIVDGVTPSG
jgi:hypothetical protein